MAFLRCRFRAIWKGEFGTDFLYCLVAFVFVCKCSPRGCRGFSRPVLGLILDGVLSYFLIPFDAGETENTGRNWRFTGASKNKQNKSRREHIFVDFDTRKEKSDYVYVLLFKNDKNVSHERDSPHLDATRKQINSIFTPTSVQVC